MRERFDGWSRPVRPWALVILLAAFAGTPAWASGAAGASSACEPDGHQASGAVTRFCMPTSMPWNGDLVIWAHGYVAFNEPLVIPENQLCGNGVCIPDIVNALGFAFATTSYSSNGLAMNGADDVVDLVDLFSVAHGNPHRVFLVGASEGGLVTTLAVERRPDVFNGGLAACGPIGDFRMQINYYGDFRVVFDYLFPGLIPGGVFDPPDSIVQNFDDFYFTVVRPVITDVANRPKVKQLLQVTGAPWDRNDLSTAEKSIRDGLWYNVLANRDAIDKLGGQPFDNHSKFYFGSYNDTLLNRQVQRFTADPSALATIDARLQTSGVLARPLVTLHTVLDQQVPYAHEPLYFLKALSNGSGGRLVELPVFRYGHCNFTPLEAVFGFAVVLLKAAGEPLHDVVSVLPDDGARAEFLSLARKYGVAAGQP